ncbi:MAG: hypothetical protein ACKV2T_02195 [Kofleriaceae bacterium]
MRALCMVFLLAGTAIAQPRVEPNLPHREGDYGGVVPGVKPDAKDGKKPKKPPTKGTLTWIGFEAKDGGAKLFFQSVAPFEVSQRVEGSSLIVTLSLTKLGQNTWRQIDTRFFDNPLSMVTAKLVKKKKGAEVRITFKNPKDAKEGSVRTATEADGMYYTYLSFPEGTPDASIPKTAPDDVER